MRTLNPRCHTYASYANADAALKRAERFIPEQALCLVAVVGKRYAPVVVTQDLSTARFLADKGITVCN